MKKGLIVRVMTKEQDKKMYELLDTTGFHAEWDSKEGVWFFPEEEENYDKLEEELTEMFEEIGIENYFFEGLF